MHKSWLIVKREYWTRVRKRSFLLITFISPVLFAFIFIAPILVSYLMNSEKTIYVIDESGIFDGKMPDKENYNFIYVDDRIETIQDKILKDNPSAYILKIPKIDLDDPKGIEIIANKNPSVTLVEFINSYIEKTIEDLKLARSGIDPNVLEKAKTHVSISSIVIGESGEKKETSTAAASGAAFVAGFFIYFLIFLYSGQVATSVHEEKSSRIVEILISSVRPIELMFGKIIGVALVGLTQFLLWIVFTLILTGVFAIILGPDVFMHAASGAHSAAIEGEQVKMYAKVFHSIGTQNIPLLIGMFIFYFLGGYFTYSSLYAAAASAVDSQTDMRQLILPISIPIILAIIITPTVILENPDSAIAVWGSIIPFTSPVVMMARLPFGVPFIQVLASVIALILGFVFCVWIAAKVYRTGILLYGKKITLKEIGKWILYKG